MEKNLTMLYKIKYFSKYVKNIFSNTRDSHSVLKMKKNETFFESFFDVEKYFDAFSVQKIVHFEMIDLLISNIHSKTTFTMISQSFHFI
jgi:hypothetical protein